MNILIPDKNSISYDRVIVESKLLRPGVLQKGKEKERKSIYIAPFTPRYAQSAQAWITQFYLQTTPWLPLRMSRFFTFPVRVETVECSYYRYWYHFVWLLESSRNTKIAVTFKRPWRSENVWDLIPILVYSQMNYFCQNSRTNGF